MIRVAFLLNDLGDGWLGGVNYYRNLITALGEVKPKRITPVLFVSSDAPQDMLASFGAVEIVRTPMFKRKSVAGVAWRIARRLSVIESAWLVRLLRSHRIDVLSHAGPLSYSSGIKTLGWIPDFQHLYLPMLFAKKELRSRDVQFQRLGRYCDGVIFSSQAARDDFLKFAPEAKAKGHILHFCPQVPSATSLPSLEQLQLQYGFSEPYFHLPNQFWAHKNHKIVIDALVIAKRKGTRLLVLATGCTQDYRNPGHYDELMAFVSKMGLADSFRVLGVVPYSDMLGLMHNSTAVINPSLFEGWSSTVEEAKALNKIIVLSDIPVHREQNPDRSFYFGINAPEQLAQILVLVNGDGTQADRNELNEIECSLRHEKNRYEYGKSFEQLVLSMLPQN